MSSSARWRAGLVARLTLNGERVVAEERLFRDVGKRIRDVRQGPDGYLYLLTDGLRARSCG